MKYAFCVVALAVQPLVSWILFRNCDKRKAALRVPMAAVSTAYLAIQFYVFFKYCLALPEKAEYVGYFVQGAVLAGFIVLEFLFAWSNKYISAVEKKEQESISVFRGLVSDLEVLKVDLDGEKLKLVSDLVDRMRYEDPVSSIEIAQEDKEIKDMIDGLSNIESLGEFREVCSSIMRKIEVRKIRNRKVSG